MDFAGFADFAETERFAALGAIFFLAALGADLRDFGAAFLIVFFDVAN